MDINLAHRPRGATHAGKEETHGSWYKKADAGHWVFIDMGEDGLPDRQWCVVPDNDPGYELIELPPETPSEAKAAAPKCDGGPAFPCSENGTSHTIAMAAMLDLPATASTDEKDKVYIQTKAKVMQGMSLRDYFAAKALQSQLDRLPDFSTTVRDYGFDKFASTIARTSYDIADAMLAARSA